MNALTTIKAAPLEGEVLPPQNPFFVQRSPFTSAKPKVMVIPEGANLRFYEAAAMADMPEAYRPHLIICIGEHEIAREHWGRVKPKEGQIVTVRVMPHGSGGKNVLRAVLQIAITIVAVYVGAAIGFAIGGPLGAVIGAVVTAAITFGGMLALNALIPPPDPTRGAGEHVPFITGGSNAYSPYGWIPRVYGKHRVYPVIAAHPYTEISGNKHYLRMLLAVGFGPLRISDIRIGNTPITDFVGVQYEVYEGGPSGWSGNTPITLYTQHITEAPIAVTLNTNGASGLQTTAASCNEIGVDIAFTQGLLEYTKKGDKIARSVTFLVQYRVAGSGGSWTNAVWISDSDNKAQKGSGTLTATETSQEAVLINGRFRVPTGQYEVQVTRQTAQGVQNGTGGNNQIDGATWTVLRSNVDSPPVLQSDVCIIAIRIKASDQLQGMVQNVNCVAESYVPIYSAGTWTYTISSNVAWVYTDIMRRRGNQILLADNRIDLPAIQSWATACDVVPANDATGVTWAFNGVLEGGSVFNSLRKVAGIGRASFAIRDGKFSVTRDVVQATPIQHITPRNSWGYSASKAFLDLPHMLKVRFLNAAKEYKEDEVYVYADGYNAGNATRFDTIDLMGCTSDKMAWREGRYHLAVGSARPEQHTVNMDVEALRCTVGDRVQLSHDVILVGQAWGRITADLDASQVATTSAAVLYFDLDQEVTFVTGKTYQLRLRHADGTSSVRTVTGIGGALGTTTRVQLGASETYASTGHAGDLFMFGETGLESAPMVVRKIEPGEDLSVKLTLVAYDPAILTADTGTIPTFTSYITNSFDPEVQKPTTPTINVRSDDTVIDVQPDGTVPGRLLVDITPGGASLVKIAEWEVQYKESSADTWQIAGRQPFNITSRSIYPTRQGAIYDVRVRGISEDGRASDWASNLSHTVVGKLNPPQLPTSATATAGYRENYVRWTNPVDSDLNYVEVLASLTNTSGSAVVVGRTLTGTFTHINLGAGATWYYWIRGVDYNLNASALVSVGSATAQSIATYDGIGADGNLSAVEKQTLIREFNDLANEKTNIDTQADAFSVSRSAYDTAYSSLTTYLAGLSSPTLWSNTGGDTTITRSTWNSTWSALYTARQNLLNAIDAKAGTTASWPLVGDTDPNHPRPADGATLNPPGGALNINDSFELFFNGQFPGWLVTGTAAQVSSTTSRRGTKSIRLTSAAVVYSNYYVPVTPGETIYIDAGWQTTGGTSALWGIGVGCYDASLTGAGNFFPVTGNSNAVAYTSASGAQSGIAAFVVPAGVSYITPWIEFERAQGASGKTGEVDWLSITREQPGATSNPVFAQPSAPTYGVGDFTRPIWSDTSSDDLYMGIGSGTFRRISTIGATAATSGGSGGTLKFSGGTVARDPDIANSGISMTSGLVLSNGVGGVYTPTLSGVQGTLGTTIDNTAIGVNGGGQITGIGTGVLSYVSNTVFNITGSGKLARFAGDTGLTNVIDNAATSFSPAGVYSTGTGATYALALDSIPDGSTYVKYPAVDKTKVATVTANASTNLNMSLVGPSGAVLTAGGAALTGTASGSYNQGAVSQNTYTGAAYCEGRLSGSHGLFGLSTNNAASNVVDVGCWVVFGGNAIAVSRDGTTTISTSALDGAAVYAIRCDGTTTTWYKNDASVGSEASISATQVMYLKAIFNVTGTAASNLRFDGANDLSRQQRLNTSGRVSDPMFYNTQAILGPNSTTNLTPAYTVNVSDVTVSLPSHTRKITGPSGAVTLSYGAVSGTVAFSTYWTAYIDDPDLTGFTSPSATFTSNPDDLLAPGRYQIASGLTPNSGGTGGTTTSGGGSGRVPVGGGVYP